jgi:phosphate transport system substrate-binding protein
LNFLKIFSFPADIPAKAYYSLKITGGGTMRPKTLATTISFILAGVLLSRVAGAAELVIPGSGNPEYVLGVLAKEFNALQGEHRVSVPTSTGTAGAVRDVLSGKAMIARVGRPLTDDERSRGLEFVPFGRDAVVFVAGAGVTARSVTLPQMIDVFSGKITDWRELGGNPAPIRAIGREMGDASRGALSSYSKAFRVVSFGPGVKVVHLDPQLIELLDRFDTSLGFLNRSALYAAKTKVVPLTLDGVEPTLANLASGRYPVRIEIGLIHKAGADLTGEARAFMNFLASPEGARILREHGIASVGAGK